jgi:CheY-like chemotaxis protein
MLVLAAFLCLVYGLGRTGRDLWRERGLVLQANEELRVAQEELRLSNEELRERNRQLVEAYVRETATMRREPIRIVVADPDPDVRRVLTLLLAAENDMEIVGQAAREEDAVAAAEGLHPDVVLIDASLTASDCIAALRSLKEPPRVVVLGSYREAALGALTAGASDYVLKDAGHNRLQEAIRRMVSADPEPSAERIQR